MPERMTPGQQRESQNTRREQINDPNFWPIRDREKPRISEMTLMPLLETMADKMITEPGEPINLDQTELRLVIGGWDNLSEEQKQWVLAASPQIAAALLKRDLLFRREPSREINV